jgi:ligand-binding sensor domain-containing protein
MMKHFLSVWLAGIIFPLCAQNISENVRITHYTSDDGLSQNRVMSILQDRKGFMWFATWDGLNKFDGNHFKVYKGEPGDPNGFTNNRLNSLLEDPAGQLWILANDRQVYRFDPVKEQFTLFSQFVSQRKIPFSSILKLSLLPDSTVCLISTEGCYLISILPSGELGTVHYLSKNNGLLSGNRINGVFKDQEKQLWLLTDRGITRYIPFDGQAQFYFYQNTNRMEFCAYLLINKDIYFGSKDGRIWHGISPQDDFTKKNFELRLPFPDFADRIGKICWS